MQDNIEVKGRKYRKVYERGACALYFSRQNTQEDGWYLGVNRETGAVMIDNAYNVWEWATDDDDDFNEDEALATVLDYGCHIRDAERYLREYGDLDMSITTLVKRLDKLEGKA